MYGGDITAIVMGYHRHHYDHQTIKMQVKARPVAHHATGRDMWLVKLGLDVSTSSCALDVEEADWTSNWTSTGRATGHVLQHQKSCNKSTICVSRRHSKAAVKNTSMVVALGTGDWPLPAVTAQCACM